MAVTEYDGEPVPGLPGRLPPGEAILWQGAPDWKRLAVSAYHVRKVAIYFAALVVLALVSGSKVGLGMTAVSGLAAVALLGLFAWLMARSTLYTITNRRVVMRFGVAVPMCVNLPMTAIATARLNARPDGSGDIALATVAGERAGYFLLWPNVRPWRFARPEPMLRALADARTPADILARAMAEALPAGRRLPIDPPAAKRSPEPRGVPA
jgi:hypothetical protein